MCTSFFLTVIVFLVPRVLAQQKKRRFITRQGFMLFYGNEIHDETQDTRHETMSKDWDLGLTRKFEGHFSPQERGARTALNFLAVCSHELRVEATAHSITKFRKNVFFVQEAG
jgi:hypothetical protein